jgi:hypothetical protein
MKVLITGRAGFCLRTPLGQAITDAVAHQRVLHAEGVA